MLAFTIQFPNNNPTPPQTHPNNNPTKGPSSPSMPAANTGQTPKHQEPLTPTNNHHQPLNTPNSASKDQQTSHQPDKEACCLKTQQHAKPYKPHTINTHLPTPTPTTPKESPAKMRTNKHQHHTAIANTPHTPHNPHKADQIACMLSGTEFIDIPPMSNPPKQHSCLA